MIHGDRERFERSAQPSDRGHTYVAKSPDTTKEPQIVATPKRIRAFVGGRLIADSKRAILRRGMPPAYFLPLQDIREDILEPTQPSKTESGRSARSSADQGEIQHWDLKFDGEKITRAAWSCPEHSELKDHIAFEWDVIDNWFEEDEEIFVHPHDPYHRIDVMESSRHVRIVHGGETIAESERPVLLFETGLPTRFYLPKIDLKLGLIEDSKKITHCPYKGEAHYYDLLLSTGKADAVAWYYRYPKPAVLNIRNMVCFFQERIDEVYVDGERI